MKVFEILIVCFAVFLGRAISVDPVPVLETAMQNGCTKLYDLAMAADLKPTLDAGNGLTIFAPSNAAFNSLPADVTHALTTNKTLLQQVLKFHVAVGMLPSSILKNDELLPTLSGSSTLRINIYKGGSKPTVDGAEILALDLKASNGFVHIIDKVIYPVPVMNTPIYLTFDPNLSNLGYMVFRGNLMKQLSGQSFTVFAPENAAIERIPGQEYNDLLMNLTALTALLTHHVIPGTVYSAGLTNGQKVTTLQGGQLEVAMTADGSVTINGAKVIRSDISTTNGVIHVLDSVLFLQGPTNTPKNSNGPVIG